jgi:hypothetical protein
MGGFVWCAFAILPLGTTMRAQAYQVCGNPTEHCGTSFRFEPYDLLFKVTGELKWFGEYRSEEFYAVVLSSRKAIPDPDGLSGDKQCSGQFKESERLAAQTFFPDNKVFASTFGCDYFQVSYTNVNADYNFMAVYAGRNQTEANLVLKMAKSAGRFPGANLRKMRAVLCNGCH